MATPSNEMLLPALLDRLQDDERMLLSVRVSLDSAKLAEAGLTATQVFNALEAQGLQPASSEDAGGDSERVFLCSPQKVSAARLRSLELRITGVSRRITLDSIAQIDARLVPNTHLESAEHNRVFIRRLRNIVCRDLSYLLNTENLASTTPLDDYPYVRESVLNYGIPALSGKVAGSVDPAALASAMVHAIERFEPRLRKVKVIPKLDLSRAERRTLTFAVEAELWSFPSAENVRLETHVDLDIGKVAVAEPGAR